MAIEELYGTIIYKGRTGDTLHWEAIQLRYQKDGTDYKERTTFKSTVDFLVESFAAGKTRSCCGIEANFCVDGDHIY